MQDGVVGAAWHTALEDNIPTAPLTVSDGHGKPATKQDSRGAHNDARPAQRSRNKAKDDEAESGYGRDCNEPDLVVDDEGPRPARAAPRPA